MKTILRYYVSILVIAFYMFGGCQENPDNQKSNDTKENLAPGVQTEQTDSGEVRTMYFDGGETYTKTQYKNGVRNGFHRAYNSDGKLTSEATYVNDKLEGPFRSWYPNGQLKNLANYKAGKLDGESLYYNDAGKIVYRYTYDDNKLKKTIKYDKDGNVEYTDTFK